MNGSRSSDVGPGGEVANQRHEPEEKSNRAGYRIQGYELPLLGDIGLNQRQKKNRERQSQGWQNQTTAPWVHSNQPMFSFKTHFSIVPENARLVCKAQVHNIAGCHGRKLAR